MAAGRQVRDVLHRTSRLHISVAVGKTNQLILIADVHPLRIRPGRIEGNTVWTLQVAGKDLRRLRLAVAGHAMEDPNPSRLALSQKNVAIRSRA